MGAPAGQCIPKWSTLKLAIPFMISSDMSCIQTLPETAVLRADPILYEAKYNENKEHVLVIGARLDRKLGSEGEEKSIKSEETIH